MTPEFGVALAFMTGIAGAFHCLGMCSGINGGFFFGLRPASPPHAMLMFHASRIAVYTALGVAGALFGRVLVQTGILGKGQGILMMLAGVAIILVGARHLRQLPRSNPATRDSYTAAVAAPSNKLNGPAPAIAGLVNGMVPCSLVFSVAVKAAATANALDAATIMIAFGAGTLPAMATLSLLASRLRLRITGVGVRLAGLVIVALGLWTVYEGLIFFDIMRGLSNW